MVQGRLGYNHENGRYGLLASDIWEHEGFHCGASLEVMINGKWKKTRMEMDWSTGKGIWYLTGTDLVGTELEYIRARIKEK